MEAPFGPPASGIVKWFSPEKGFGFVELSDGSGDAFLHGTVLAQSGAAAVQPGAIVFVAARLAFWVGYRIHPL